MPLWFLYNAAIQGISIVPDVLFKVLLTSLLEVLWIIRSLENFYDLFVQRKSILGNNLWLYLNEIALSVYLFIIWRYTLYKSTWYV